MRLLKYAFFASSFLLFIACSSDNGGGSGPTPPTDTQAPSVPSNASVTNITETSANLTWTASTDNVGVALYRIFNSNTLLKTSGGTSTSLTGLAKDTQYSIQISARDAAGNESGKSATLTFTTLGDCPSSGTLFPGETGAQLVASIKNCFTPSTTFTYSQARTRMYTDVDVWDDGKIHTIYTDQIIDKATSTNTAISDTFDRGVNCEHLFPQSKGADQEPARSDMFHLAPCDIDVNSDRSAWPYAEIPDASTQNWYYKTNKQGSIPSSNIDNWSEGIIGSKWEPREAVKGDIARAMFYFMIIHSGTADQNFFNGMKTTLLDWHDQDPVDTREMQRNGKVKSYQGNDNPFIIDPDLADRVF